MQNWNLVPFFGLNQRYFVLFLSANSKISHINSRNKCVKNFNTNWNGTPCKQRKYAVLFPHAWECSIISEAVLVNGNPFPTCVGVFRHVHGINTLSSPFSHMRGSVPDEVIFRRVNLDLFPHAWECSLKIQLFDNSFKPFPTCVGVFLRLQDHHHGCSTFSHMRGSIPSLSAKAVFSHASGSVRYIGVIYH